MINNIRSSCIKGVAGPRFDEKHFLIEFDENWHMPSNACYAPNTEILSDSKSLKFSQNTIIYPEKCASNQTITMGRDGRALNDTSSQHPVIYNCDVSKR